MKYAFFIPDARYSASIDGRIEANSDGTATFHSNGPIIGSDADQIDVQFPLSIGMDQRSTQTLDQTGGTHWDLEGRRVLVLLKKDPQTGAEGGQVLAW